MAPLNHQLGRPNERARLSVVQRPTMWRRVLRALELETEDLLAIPLCLVLGFAFSLYSLRGNGLMSAVQSSPVAISNDSGASGVVALLSVPAAAVRQWFS